MDKRILLQDNPRQFYLLIGRIIGFLVTAIFIRFMIPKFISLLNHTSVINEGWVLIFYFLSIAYVFGFLLSFWKVGLSGLLLVISSILIAVYSFIDSKNWLVLFLFFPLSFSGILFLIYWKKMRN